MATSKIRFGPMVTPLARRRPQKVVRETIALDRLSSGRLTFGVGLGVNTGGELARFGEVVDDRLRGDMLDEAITILLAAWSGKLVEHSGRFYQVDSMVFTPGPIQIPRIPIWVAARGAGAVRPLMRASRLDGLFPVRTTLDQLSRMLDVIGTNRGDLEGFDVAFVQELGQDSSALEQAGVTWVMRPIKEGADRERTMSEITAGPHQ